MSSPERSELHGLSPERGASPEHEEAPRRRYDTVDSQFAGEEDDDYLNYSENMALHDALQNYC